jgi:hypothetical protein
LGSIFTESYIIFVKKVVWIEDNFGSEKIFIRALQ